MAFSKTLLLLGLAFAIVLLISSEISARELHETNQTQNSSGIDVEESSNNGVGNDNGKDCGCSTHGDGKGQDEHDREYHDEWIEKSTGQTNVKESNCSVGYNGTDSSCGNSSNQNNGNGGNDQDNSGHEGERP
ncbi:N66 matrix protein-like [Pistacia vera]|uniref:N66 matrix protein-like n=1 Tax=Pistacia vera TaxID=55513 RepID=UPI0012630058|nr:N66 matrix protein-like [Pistacia vera]